RAIHPAPPRATCSACADSASAAGSFPRFFRPGLGLDDGLDPAAGRSLAGDREEVRALVDEDVIARDLVAVAVDPGLLEQLDLLVAIVHFDTQRLAVHPAALLAVLRVLPLTKAHR